MVSGKDADSCTQGGGYKEKEPGKDITTFLKQRDERYRENPRGHEQLMRGTM